ncbi:hypothetical protein, partial [Rhizobium phaseoli]|uniref:hypothetical protein n=1 Tax=Rhizobium phaseoli TaxID=396 RepID=UPI001AEE612C
FFGFGFVFFGVRWFCGVFVFVGFYFFIFSTTIKGPQCKNKNPSQTPPPRIQKKTKPKTKQLGRPTAHPPPTPIPAS